MKTTNDIIRIVGVGGGVVIDDRLTTEDMIRIVSVAKNNDAKVIIKNVSRKTTEDLIRIGAAGKGSVTFEI